MLFEADTAHNRFEKFLNFEAQCSYKIVQVFRRVTIGVSISSGPTQLDVLTPYGLGKHRFLHEEIKTVIGQIKLDQVVSGHNVCNSKPL